eukprot:scaffold82799_cov46-Prasinocladus_malaysianus.AAC.1
MPGAPRICTWYAMELTVNWMCFAIRHIFAQRRVPGRESEFPAILIELILVIADIGQGGKRKLL